MFEIYLNISMFNEYSFSLVVLNLWCREFQEELREAESFVVTSIICNPYLFCKVTEILILLNVLQFQKLVTLCSTFHYFSAHRTVAIQELECFSFQYPC